MIAHVEYIGDDSKTHDGVLVQFVYRPTYPDFAHGAHRTARCVGIILHNKRFVEVPREELTFKRWCE